jgi:hypothetical protein
MPSSEVYCVRVLICSPAGVLFPQCGEVGAAHEVLCTRQVFALAETDPAPYAG